MKTKKIVFLIFIVILFSSCKTKTTEVIEIEQHFILPEGAIPIVYYPKHIYIEGKIDSIDGRFVFDTGADGLYFDSTYYANTPFTNFNFFKGILPGAGTSGNQSVIVIKDTLSFEFGQYTYQTPNAVVLRLKPILGDFADGIIGQSYFSDNKYLMEINYFHEYLILHTDTSTIDLSNYTKISMEKRRNRFFVPITIHINDSLSIQENFTLDIGSGGTISLRNKIAEKYNLSSQISDKVHFYSKYRGVGGRSSSVYFKANSIEIGEYKLYDVIMDYSEDMSGAMASNFYSGGLLGNRLLEYFDVVIDFKDYTALYLKPNQNFGNPFEFGKLGFNSKNRNQTMNAWVVSGFFKDSPAEKSGLKIDDKIIFVNGIDIHNISFKDEKSFWKSLDRIKLVVLRDCEQMEFEFELWEF